MGFNRVSISTKIYQTLFRRTSMFTLTIVVGALFFERAFDESTEYIFNRINAGKQYKDLKKQLAQRAAKEE
ncbi:hypothetical protein CHS0354_009973 [Potamilus streckersoni]|uniref:Complex III subunit 9 n=1 Tax=Potamilus streckersoni TaxID=2493646 RepID=A0AAE0TB82_9BIVA|nr:hypothetical protein CHS0354_009973 [Potamilus streckersoni]